MPPGLNPGSWLHQYIPSRQMLWVLHLPACSSWAIIWSNMLVQISLSTLPMRLVTGSSPSFRLAWAPTLTKVRVCWGADLPVHLSKGQSMDWHHGKYIGAHVQRVLPLIDGKDSCSNLILGRLNIPVVVTVNNPLTVSFTIITSRRQTCNITNSLQYA